MKKLGYIQFVALFDLRIICISSIKCGGIYIMQCEIRKYLIKLIILSALTKACSVLFPLITQHAIDAGVAGKLDIIFTSILVLIALAVTNAIIDALDQFVEEKYRNYLAHTYRLKLSRYIASLKQKQFDEKSFAEYVSLFNNNISLVVENYYIMILNIIKCTFVVIFSISALFQLNKCLTAVIVITSVLTILNPFIFRKALDHQMKNVSDAMKELNNRLNDFLKGYQLGRIFLVIPKLCNRLDDASQNLMYQNMKHWKIMLRPNIISVFLTYFRDISIVAIGVRLMLQNQITVGGVFAAIQLSNLLCVPAVHISYLIGNVLSSKTIKQELDEMTKESKGQCIFSDISNDNISTNIVTMCPANIIFKNVSFSYKNKKVLDNINLCFEAGKKYLLIGSSGSGKSTILKLLSNLYEDYSGKIIVNCSDIREIKKWNTQVSMCFQDTIIFQDTLRNNMTLWGLYENQKMDDLIKNMQLCDLMDSCGLDNKCLNSEKTFSGGEKQRIALIRTFLKPAWLILLDEVTSALDYMNYLRVEKYILSLPNCTVINVSHKINPEIANKYDAIVLLEHGKIICTGSFDELINSNTSFQNFLLEKN